MTSDIDELLECLREQEHRHRDEARKASERHGDNPIEADRLARWIAAVEQLRQDNAFSVTLAPTVGLQPMAILDPPEPLRRNRNRPIEEVTDGD